MNTAFSIKNTTKGKLPSLPFALMKDEVLGKDYELSVVVVGDKKMAELNKTYRQKDAPTDILSFPLDNKSGEIFLDLNYAKKKALGFGRKFENFIGFLFIHGLVHLKGFDHGEKMEQEEIVFRKKFNI